MSFVCGAWTVSGSAVRDCNKERPHRSQSQAERVITGGLTNREHRQSETQGLGEGKRWGVMQQPKQSMGRAGGGGGDLMARTNITSPMNTWMALWWSLWFRNAGSSQSPRASTEAVAESNKELLSRLRNRNEVQGAWAGAGRGSVTERGIR